MRELKKVPKRCQNCNYKYRIQNVLDDATGTIMHLCHQCYKWLKEQLDYDERYKK